MARDGALDAHPAGVAIVDKAVLSDLQWNGARFVLSWRGMFAQDPGPRPTRLVAWLLSLGNAPTNAQPVAPENVDVGIVPIDAKSIAATYARSVDDPSFGSVSRAFVNVVSAGTVRRHATH
ncbi:MAG: hypothetical protein JOZ54_08960 [Acidobacteria bacterium]|nr:hypothetical protein [Acidobacteriota bacterium]